MDKKKIERINELARKRKAAGLTPEESRLPGAELAGSAEGFGGGGHMNIAGAQFEGISVEEAIDRLKDILDSMIDD